MTKTKAKHPGGRPSKLNYLDMSEVERLGGLGLTLDEVGYVLGVTTQTIHNWKKNPKFFDALKKGRAQADSRIKQSLYQRALEGDVTAQIFWLKNRDPKNWGDKRQLDISSDDSSEVVIKVVKTESQGAKKDGD